MTSMLKNNVAFYIGIPFCKKACNYCHYRPNIRFGTETIPDVYFTTLLIQIQSFLQKYNIRNSTLLSCYFGGGTPSLLSTQQISSIFSLFKDNGIFFKKHR